MGEVINQLRLSFFAWLSSRTVIQELGREEILPFSSFFASNRPFNAPLAGIFTEYLVTCIYLISVPPGDAYIFLINSKSSISGLDAFKLRFGQWYLMGGLLFIPWFHLACSSYTYRHIEFGTGILLFELRNLLFLYISCLTFFWWLRHSFHRLQGHTKIFRTGYVIYLLILCSLQTWFISLFQSHSISSFIVTFLGITYWYIWSIWLPKRKGYFLQREWVDGKDDISRYVFRRVPRSTWAWFMVTHCHTLVTQVR